MVRESHAAGQAATWLVLPTLPTPTHTNTLPGPRPGRHGVPGRADPERAGYPELVTPPGKRRTLRLRSLTKHVAQWFGKDNIRCNSVHPGAIYTGMAKAASIKSREEM